MRRLGRSNRRSSVGLCLTLAAATLITWTLCTDAASAGTADKWRDTLHEIDSLLRRGDYGAASREAERFSNKSLGKLGTGDGARYALGLGCMFRAIAEMGLGNEAEALWYRAVAAAISPGIEGADLSPYGTTAAFLAGAAKAADTLRAEPSGTPLTGRVERPNCHRQIRPEYPGSLQLRGGGSVVVVQVLVSEDGSLSQPSLVSQGNGPAEEFAAFEVLPRWRCSPASQGGVPIKVFYSLTVTFR